MKVRYLLPFLFIVPFTGCKNADYYAHEGLKHLQQGHKITALRNFETAYEKDKDNPLALYGKGIILIDSGITIDMGLESLEKAIPGLSDIEYKADAYLKLARGYKGLKKDTKAIHKLEEAIKNKVDDARIYHVLAGLYLNLPVKKEDKKKNFERALTLYQEGVKRFPEDAALNREYGIHLLTDLKLEIEALQFLEKSNVASANNPVTLKAIMKASYLLKDIKKAQEALKNLLSVIKSEKEKEELIEIQKKIEKRSWKPA